MVKDIVSMEESRPVATAGDSVSLVLADDIDISRGDLLVEPDSAPRSAKAIEARICWLSSQLLDVRALPAARFVLKHTTRSVKARLISITSRLDVTTLAQQPSPAGLAMNDIADVAIALSQPIFVDPYRSNRATGSFILVDEVSNQTLAAGMIE
jgi:sulfate adenylyltransferase subunit 1